MSDTVTRAASPSTLVERPVAGVTPDLSVDVSPPPVGVPPATAVQRLGRRVLAWPLWAQVLTVYVLSRVVAGVIIELVAVTVQNPAGVRDLHPTYADLAGVWDGQWYQQIAEQGYPDGLPRTDVGRVDYNSWAFFPLFPALVRVVMVTGLPFVAAATVVNLAAAGAAVLVLYRLFTHRGPRTPAAPRWLVLLAVALWSVLPPAPVLQVAYTEALAALLLAGSLLLLVRRHYVWAVPVVLALGLTRAVAAPLLLVVVWHAVGRWRHRDVDPLTRQHVVRLVVLAGATGLSAVLWPAVVGIATGVPDAFFQTQAVWGQRPAKGLFLPWLTWAWAGAGVFGVLALVGVVSLWVGLLLGRHGRWLSTELRVWAIVYPVYLLAVVRPITSMWRFLLLDFPIAAVLASVVARGRVTGPSVPRLPWRELRWRLAAAGLMGVVGMTWWVGVLLTRTPWSDSPP